MSRPTPRWRDAMRSPAIVRGVLIALCFALIVGALISWTRTRQLVSPGRVMTDTRTVRVAFELEDPEATNSRRQGARNAAPRVYIEDATAFNEIESSLANLPTTLADAEDLDQVAPDIREGFNLTQERLDAIRSFARDDASQRSWTRRVDQLISQLRTIPVVEAQSWQLAQQSPSDRIELRSDQSAPTRAMKDRLVPFGGDQYVDAMTLAVRSVGFSGESTDLIVERLTNKHRPTFVFDQAATDELAEQLVAAIEPSIVRHPIGRVIYSEGQVLDEKTHALLQEEERAYSGARDIAGMWIDRAGALGASLIVTIAMMVYLTTFCPRIVRNPWRVFAIAVLMTACLLAATITSVAEPKFIHLFATGPTIFVAVAMVIAYEQRTAFALSSMHGLLVCLALNLPLSFLAMIMAGSGAMIWKLREIRQRDALIRAGLFSGGVLAISSALAGVLEAPIVPAIWTQLGWDAALAGLGGVGVGFLTLGILPSLERIFDITTGMTLIELRDPKNPLLRELQQRAPGTYNHSLNVATLAESAADAIGADGLHLYVGALYHDIGKMNKPEYFVENQMGGPNRHTRLSPAMSLLVIVGHVKDGVELAREYGLPRALHHYIESHHGTTLVEYFFHAAKKKADEDEDVDHPAEVEYRYPGPKPRTREAAILMLCDAVESAARAMSDPSPSRIEAMVHSIATKRLMDGQFDDSDLTLRELHVIEASLVKSLNSIYHGRIAYPEAETETKGADQRAAAGGNSGA